MSGDGAYRDLFSLEDRVMIVTGGAGHLGSEMSKGLAAFGARVIAVGRTETRFQELRDFRPERSTGRIECRACDVRDEAAFAAVVEDVWRQHGRLDALINNAASGGREKWDDCTTEAWRAGMAGTLDQVFTCTKAASSYMLKARRGVIVNTASLWSFLAPNPNMYLDLNIQAPAHTLAAKGGVLQLTKYLAAVWAPHGIRVNALTPGWCPKKRGPDRPDYMREITNRVPMERVGVPSDLVGAIVFLVSDASSYMTGHNLVVDGGYSIW